MSRYSIFRAKKIRGYIVPVLVSSTLVLCALVAARAFPTYNTIASGTGVLEPEQVGPASAVAACFGSLSGAYCSSTSTHYDFTWGASNCVAYGDSSLRIQLVDSMTGAVVQQQNTGDCSGGSSTFVWNSDPSHTYGISIYGQQTNTQYDSSSFSGVSCLAVSTWTTYCTGGSDPNGNNWQWWQFDQYGNYQYIRPGDGTCTPTSPASIWTTYCTGGSDVNGNNWQWWRYDQYGTYTFVRPGDGSCVAPTPSATIPTTPPTISVCVASDCGPQLPGTPRTLVWDCPNPPYVTSAGFGFSSGGALHGSITVSPLSTTTYGVQCNPGGMVATTIAEVEQPSITLTAVPPMVRTGNSTNLLWSAQGVTSCQLSGKNINEVHNANVNGTINTITTPSGAVLASQIYTLRCQSAVGPVSTTATVTIVPTTIEPGFNSPTTF